MAEPNPAPPRHDGDAPALSIVLPVYDEGRTLEATFGALLPFLDGLGRTFEVVCVNDGSTDDSAAKLARAAERDPRVRVLDLSRNRGKGAAVRAGMLAARGDLALFMDADLSTPLEEIPRALGALESGYDVVLGNRRSPGSRITRRQPKLREFFGRGFTLLTRLALAPGVQDFTCGFKGFTREAARAVFERSTLNGWAFDAELVVIAQEQDLRLVQVPVLWRHEDDTKVRLVNAILVSLVDLARIFAMRLGGRYR
jgi:glycosyltransferase involved in cell wall biosynthesis